MIVGIGLDIVETRRLREALERRSERFLARTFTAAERELGESRGKGAEQFFAGRWAAKEALAKALGCGCGPDCSWQEIEILNDEQGRPVITLRGVTEATALALGPLKLHASISHEVNYACAVVLAEK